WLDPEELHKEPLSKFQQGYLTHNGYLVRALIYFAVWLALMFIFNGLSKQQDTNREDRALRRRLKMLAGPGIILYVFAMSFAAIDWVMSLSPHWASRSEEHASELQSRGHLVCRLLLEKKK